MNNARFIQFFFCFVVVFNQAYYRHLLITN